MAGRQTIGGIADTTAELVQELVGGEAGMNSPWIWTCL